MDPRIRSTERDRKVEARHRRWPVSGRSVFLIQFLINKRTQEAKAKKENGNGNG